MGPRPLPSVATRRRPAGDCFAASPQESDVRARDHSPGGGRWVPATPSILPENSFPAHASSPGSKAFYLLTGTETGTIMTISLWETRDQMEAVEAQAVLYRRSLQMSDLGCE